MEWLCRAHDARYGARALARRVRTELEPAIADCILADPPAIRLRAVAEGDGLKVRVEHD